MVYLIVLPWGLNFYWKRVSIVPSMSLVDVIVMLVIFQVYYFQYDLNGNSYKLYCKNKYLGRHCTLSGTQF